MSSKQEKLDALHKAMSKCKKCALRKGCFQVVPGSGSAQAKIMFIGEAPGGKEDEIGIPFIGSSGKFLDEMLEIIKLKRDDVYIANIVKCRPPKNRDPRRKEKEACWPWLIDQIKMIKPKLIVTLGRHSMDLFLPDQKISQAHGKAMNQEIKGIGRQTFYTLYHPFAALCNGKIRKDLIKDFKQIPKVIERIKDSTSSSRGEK